MTTLTPPSKGIATTASTWYAAYSGFTSVRRAQSHAKVSSPTHGRAGHTIVTLHGDLDIATAPALRAHLLGALQHSARLLILDLGEVTFCDAAGLAVLTDVQRRATGFGVAVRLANPRAQTAKLLRITGLDRRFLLQPATPAGPTTYRALSKSQAV
ncbi:STAS domain-containing protein [Spirillospora sp. NPDC029432]|uniref:STAS domain-containing protein n=1 Tax=Spirillospora sp. NPDC029432 TaxID=3154599 RepID=UPI0034531B33